MVQRWLFSLYPASDPDISNLSWVSRICWQHNMAWGLPGFYTTGLVEFWEGKTHAQVLSCFAEPVELTLVASYGDSAYDSVMSSHRRAPGTCVHDFRFERVTDVLAYKALVGLIVLNTRKSTSKMPRTKAASYADVVAKLTSMTRDIERLEAYIKEILCCVESIAVTRPSTPSTPAPVHETATPAMSVLDWD